MQAPYFPVDMETAFHAHIKFQEVFPHQALRIYDTITAMPFRLHHPNAAVGYLVQIEDVQVAYVTDRV